MKKCLFLVLSLVLITFAGCGGGGGGSTTSPVDVSTLDGRTDVSTSATFKNTFATAMNTATVTASSFFILPAITSTSSLKSYDPTICDVSQALSATVSCSGPTQCTLTPSSNLSGGTLYTICLTPDILDVSGNPYEGFSASFKTEGGGNLPSAPTGVSATAGDAQNTIEWDGATGATSYNIYWKNSAGVTTSDTKIEGATSPYVHTGLTNGTIYYYAVTSLNNDGESTLSTEVSATPQLPAPGAPQNPGVTAGYEETTVEWDAVAGADSYNIYWSKTAGVTPENGTKIAGATSPYTHAQDGAQGWLTGGATYYYVITAVNAGGEGNPSSQVSAQAAHPILKAFVTSTTYTGGAFGAVSGADSICQARAEAAGLRHSSSFKAWISDSTNDAYCRITGYSGKKGTNCGQGSLPTGAGPWQRTDGKPFASTISEMLHDKNKIYMPLRYNEIGVEVNEAVISAYTGTDVTGVVSGTPCDDWTSSDGGKSARVGNEQQTAWGWTDIGNGACNDTRHLICLQTGTGSSLPSFVETGKKVFVTSLTHDADFDDGAGGLVGADAFCQARADAQGLGGTYKAWLSTAGTVIKAIDRITEGARVRVDGVKVAENKAGLIADGKLLAPINVTESGSYLMNSSVWTGTNHNGTEAINTCNDWAVNVGGSGIVGTANYSRKDADNISWTYYAAMTCSNTFRIYCFED